MLHQRSGMSGVPGLRVSFNSRGAVLRRLQLPGKILLLGITEESWRRALRSEYDESLLANEYLAERKVLHGEEEYTIENYSFSCNSVRDTRIAKSILSGLVRRPHVFRARSRMYFTDVWCNNFYDGSVINVEWAGDLPHGDAISMLTDPKFGLPLRFKRPEYCHCEPCAEQTYSIDLCDIETGSTELHLRRSSLYDEKLPKKISGRCRGQAENSTDASLAESVEVR